MGMARVASANKKAGYKKCIYKYVKTIGTKSSF
jgi:hypothetical protein